MICGSYEDRGHIRAFGDTQKTNSGNHLHPGNHFISSKSMKTIEEYIKSYQFTTIDEASDGTGSFIAYPLLKIATPATQKQNISPNCGTGIIF